QESGGSKEVFSRLDAVRTGGVLARTGYIGTGYAAGDVMEDQGSYGPIIFGNSTKQSSIEGLSGYKAITAGFGFLGDAPILDHFRAGLGASYANSVVRQSNNTGSHTTIGSAQGMAYGSATYGRLFLDAVLSAGINNYHAKRNVNFMGITATSRYTGFQCGAKIKTGFAIPFHQINISPIVAVQYMHLNVGQYIEKDAGTLNQHLSAMRTNTVRVNLGGKIAEKRLEGTFFPEFHTFYIVDVKNPQVTLTSRFLEGGGSFDSKTVVPPKHGVSLGASVTALISDSFTLSGGYDLEKKSSFKSHSASLKFKFLF
ncbi:MAG TPA: autotransporter outer membrane beta-barrel domain-containing protein, partial [Gammaproteobacteria bacterium]|nr:autotransporter outer membrane beta-barrel domain-containing protein [Gammaproteobacteria bacterium]